MKTCTICHEAKPLTEFHKRRASSDGLYYKCKLCVLQERRAYVAAHPEAARASDAASRQRHLEKRRAKARNFYQRRPEVWAAWRQANPENLRVRRSNNRARQAGTPGTLTLEQWKEICLFYGNACAECHASAVPLTIDHFIPTAKGGENTWRNVWPLCLPCNQTKHDKIPAGSQPPHVAVLEKTGTND